MLRIVSRDYKRVDVENIMASHAFVVMCEIFNPASVWIDLHLLGIVNDVVDSMCSEPHGSAMPLSNNESPDIGSNYMACRLNHIHPHDDAKIDNDDATLETMYANIANNNVFIEYETSGSYAYDAVLNSTLFVTIDEDDTTVEVSLPTGANAVEGSIVKVAYLALNSKTDDSNREVLVIGIGAGHSSSSISIYDAGYALFMRVEIDNVLQWVYV